eukprot:3362295-Ditylum_brightwellii.AAC.1
MTGWGVYNTLLDVFQGKEHEEDNAMNSALLCERLKSNGYSCYRPETFFANTNKYLKHIKVDDGKGENPRPLAYMILSGIFHAKIDHPTFQIWKELLKKSKEDCRSIPKTFL